MFFHPFLRNACVFFINAENFLYFFPPFSFPLSNKATPTDMERRSKTASLRKKEEKQMTERMSYK